jgi:hypothetical protein
MTTFFGVEKAAEDGRRVEFRPEMEVLASPKLIKVVDLRAAVLYGGRVAERGYWVLAST